METMIVEEYLEAVFKLGGREKKLGSTKLSRELNVSPASTTEMMDRLAARGLVKKSSDAGITLTGSGRKLALQVIRRHRILERFLVDVLGMNWKDVHEEACRLEHALSPRVEARMEAMLENGATCPHGHPIPDAQGRTREAPTRTLTDLPIGQEAVIARIAEEKPDLLEYLATIGMTPGSKVVVEQTAPFDGPLTIRVIGGLFAVGPETARKILVQA